MKNTQAVLAELFELLRIPSIAGKPEHAGDMHRATEWLQKKLHDIGFEARVMETSFQPVVYGEWLHAGKDAPTVLIYGHYDVQAPEPLNEWKSEPFEPVVRDGNIYCRGVADDKGQFFTWIAALDQLLLENKTLPVNVILLIEGAEEEGSRGLAEFVEKNRDLLAADVCVISDSHALSEKQPLITYGLRGLVYMEVVLQILKQDVHSGMYGGNVRNAAMELATLLSQLKDPATHQILLPGFYDDVRELTATELKELEAFPFGEKEVRAETGATEVVGEAGYSVAARAGARPTLDINGMWSGYTGEGGKTIIPATAHAKVSMRLVPNQQTNDIAAKFQARIDELVPNGVAVTVKQLHGSEPIIFDRSALWFRAAETSLKATFGVQPLYELSGGSIGVTETFKRVLGIDCILMGYGLPDDNLHAPNEKLNVAMFEKGIETNKIFLTMLTRL